MQLNLLEKTELRIYGLELRQVNLNQVAAKVAEVLALPPAQVLVVDVRDDHICLDILAKTVDLRQLIGKQSELLQTLAGIKGLVLKEGAYVDSSGIMGLIGYEQADAAEIVARTEALGTEIEQAVLRRAIVFATGFEVKRAMIEDTNSPYLVGLLGQQGYRAEFGGILEDDISVIAHALRDAVDRGFGLIVTTGGVGAEDKDCSVEALATIDPEAAMPWIVKFQAGTGRHVKDSVRIGAGQYGLTTLLSLPGPHDEVVAAAAALQRHCTAGRIDKIALANDVAQILREKLQHKRGHGHGH
jgi:molybdenum cofactor synthesis domain-containing protein